jgi:hypothetical protein
MLNPIELYRKSHDAQWTWIRNNPVKYVALNAAIIMVFIGYTEYKDRKDLRKYREDFERRIQN